jgi:hypothetical protein
MTVKADFSVKVTLDSWDLTLLRWLEIRNENPIELSVIGVAYTSRGGSELQSE